MRIPIRVQLGGLILLASLIGLAVISIAVWVTVQDFVLSLRASRLAQTASLKAMQLASELDVMQTSVSFVATRVLVQDALERYNMGNNTEENWADASSDMTAAIGGSHSRGQALLLQSRIYGRDASGPASSNPLLNTTADSAQRIDLPVAFANGTQVTLGSNGDEFGYPPWLYPNLTFSIGASSSGINSAQATYADVTLQSGSDRSSLLLGPWIVNDSLSLVSITVPIVNNLNQDETLGWLTCMLNGSLISAVMADRQGLGETGDTLILGPATRSNFSPKPATTITDEQPDFEVRYVLPLDPMYKNRHPDHVQGTANAAFNASKTTTIYRAVENAFENPVNGSGSSIRGQTEANQPVSVGFAKMDSPIVDWIVMIEQSRKEVWQPIDKLRNVIIACVFATAALMAFIAFPLAHFAALPIVRLREATRRTTEVPSSSLGISRSSFGSLPSMRGGQHGEGQDDQPHDDRAEVARKEGYIGPVSRWKRKRQEAAQAKRDERRKRLFRIPGKVKERKSCLKDELSDLATTFNAMSDELMMQYSRLEERVQQRTAELEFSKKAAEAANESKTLFIANISHELKTPLNGILGMCAVCMQEDDPTRLKRSLGIIYKSGDLLLNLLTDLLTFSKNQVGQTLSLDEKDFRLRDISSQTLAIFEKQSKEGEIDLRVQFEGVDSGEIGPGATGRLRDMILWGDVHRILQVVINLVSNSLKFTPAGGSVVLTIRCLPELPDLGSRKSSFHSRGPRPSTSVSEYQGSSLSVPRLSTANAINAKDKPHAMARVSTTEHHSSPSNAKHVFFEFEVRDTGPGIPENQQDKIFEPFVQGDLGLSKKYGGTGLGLSICSQLASLMRGQMCVRSTVGVGSTFTMKIPLRYLLSRADSFGSLTGDRGGESGSRHSSVDTSDHHGLVEHAESTTASPQGDPTSTKSRPVGQDSKPRLVGLSQPFFATDQPMESPGSQPGAMKQIAAEATRVGKIRVLVAEDNKINQEVVLRMLKLEDVYDVTVAKDGQEALDVVKESMRGGGPPFNLIFMDVQMPNVDGIQSTKLIREIGYQAPIVALTAFAEESNIKDCLDSGMNYFLAKPIRRPQLKKVLKEYCAPIPEEPEETTMPAAVQERRGSGASTTIVLVNGRVATDVVPDIEPITLASTSNDTGPPTRSDIRPVSSRDTS
ncbi:hypothetical protein DOTSEDRAFT_70515 [Dothistroma septosporum NZE10]|uniref:histidine kinase n=1 Tax=Dothistroma septosporum (strain NZE10 / CBS 128990) TaxID=675120 RepID=N1PSU7_DOTSN|nr:hypothetical protein DOTSEDRAFT_70515 [Dothistroma septosporum NZE10]